MGMVNHLNLYDLKHDNPAFNPTNILDYISLEVNRNVLCKFLLLRTDFNKPITNEEYDAIIEMFQGSNKPVYDIYKYPLNTLPVLSKLVGVDITPLGFRTNCKKDDILVKNVICNKIKQLNKYDFDLFNYLSI